MTRPTKGIMDCSTGIETFVELTDEEIAELEIVNAKAAEENAKAKAAEEALAELKASAKAKLIAGEPLTEEEASVLVI
jgi:uncharacterized coiled-coil DUF342 family protein